MGYKVVAGKEEMDMMRLKYGPRKGLEGPFNFGGRVLYYDNKEGAYYDPRSDFLRRTRRNEPNSRPITNCTGKITQF